MSFRVLTTIFALTLVSPAFSQEKLPLPPITAQMQPIGKTLDDIKQLVRTVSGPMANDAIKAMEESLKKGLGDKGFTGVDLVRPLLGYAYLDEAVEDSTGFVLIPITSEDDFKDFVSRITPHDPLKLVPVKGNKGLYSLESKAGDGKPSVRLRFHNGYAYVAVNTPDKQFDPKVLVPADDLFVPSDRSAFSYRGYIDRYPVGLKKHYFDLLESLGEQVNQSPAPDAAKTAVKDLSGLVRRLGEQMLSEGDVVTFRVLLNAATGELNFENGLIAKKESKLAKDIAARKPTTNRFAGLITPNTAAGFVLQLPLFAPEIRNSVASGLEVAQKQFGEEVPPPYQELAAEVVKGLARTVKTGEFDIAAALTTPSKDGLSHIAFAISYDDTAKFETLLRKLYKDAPEEIQNQIKLDAAKVGDIGIHRAPVGLFLPEPAKKLFGEKAAVAVAFAPKGIYVTFGVDALGTMKTALAAKPGPAHAFDVVLHPSHIINLANRATPNSGDAVEQVIGKENKLISAVHIAIEGGEELKVRFGINLKVISRAPLGTNASGTFEVVPDSK